MKQYLIIILIAFHLLSSSAYATKTFLDKKHMNNDTQKCFIHQHQHSHNGSHHQHKHAHSQINLNYVDFFTKIYDWNLYDFSNPKQVYLETVAWIPDPTLESLFRPPKI